MKMFSIIQYLIENIVTNPVFGPVGKNLTAAKQYIGRRMYVCSR